MAVIYWMLYLGITGRVVSWFSVARQTFPGPAHSISVSCEVTKNFEKAKSNEAGLTADGAVSCLVVCLRLKRLADVVRDES